ncbi:MAG: hypothetical protein ACREDT_13540 [Methylocella sp.]
MLALIYPVGTIFLIWAISGHVGPAEKALRLGPDIPGLARGLFAGLFGFAGFVFWRGQRTAGRKTFIWAASTVAAASFVGASVYVFLRDNVDPLRLPYTDIAIPGIIVLSLGSPVVVAMVSTAAGFGAIALALIVAIFGFFPAVAFAVAGPFAIKYRRQGVFLSLFLPAMILGCLGAAYAFPTFPLLLFLGLLTLLDAPFDWASLGLTRALMRRGLELGGWWPYAYACFDALLAAVIDALLALTMVIGVQAFDELAVHGGGKKAMLLPLDKLFDGIAKNPTAPEYWWAYALLLSTMIPSLVNLAIGGMAVTRGIPGVSRLLLRWIPEGRDVPDYRRPLAALVLTGQMFAGAFLGVVAQAILAWGLIFHVMPAVGLDLLDMARAVAKFDVPLRAYRLVAGIL